MGATNNINFIFQLNNKERSANTFILYIASGIVFIGLGFFFLARNMYIFLIADSIVTIIYFYMFNNIRPSYFEFLVTERAVQFNFYSVASAMRSYRSIEIPQEQLKGYEVKRSFLGLKKELIISIESKYGIADYPPISITILNKNEISQVLHVLQKIMNS